MHPAMQRRRHRLMARRATRRSAPGRGVLTFLLVSFGVLALLVGGSVAGTAGGLLAAYNFYATGLPDPRLLDDIRLPASTYVYDRTGQTLLARFECQNREQVNFRELPDYVVDATVAAEDRTFWANDGVDYSAVARAALANLEAGEVVQGASTITAQVIKYAGSIKLEGERDQAAASAAPTIELDPDAADAQPDPEACAPPELTFLQDRSYEDKIREFILARQMTEAYPGRAGKERILETYLNLIFYGNGSYGIKAAAANYFGIANLDELTLAQAAFLAGLPQLPSVYDPYFNDQGPERAIARRNDVLDAMLRDGYINRRQHDRAAATTWEEMGPNQISSVLLEPHFSFRVQREAERIFEAMGKANPAEEVRTGGYRITTTLDFGLQQEARAAVARWVEQLKGKNANNGALVAIDSRTGEIVAYVGSVNYYNREDPRVQGQFDVAGLGLRQPGSAYKPITYSSAFVAREATPATFFVDSTTVFGNADRPDTAYIPTNADITDHGPLLAMDALRYSLNVPSVKMQYLVGAEATAEFSESMGVASAEYIMGEDPGLTLTLGSVPVNLTNFTGAYSVFAQEGALNPPTTIIQIRDRNNRVVYTREDDGPKPTRPMTTAEAYLTHWIIESNTDPRRNLTWGPISQIVDGGGTRREAGVKTGTTNDFRDVTTFGYVPDGLVTGVWMGNNNQEPLSTALGGVFSADGPLYLWQEFMEIALNRPWDWNGQEPFPRTTFERPDEIVMANVCRFSGMAATSGCGPTIEMPFLEGTVPPPDNVHGDGCLDIEQAVDQDPRRPPEWVQAAKRWADRYVNGETGSRGDPDQMGTLGPERVWMRIAPIRGAPGYGGAICGELKATPTPEPTPEDPGDGSGGPKPSECPRRGPNRCTPGPTVQTAPGDGDAVDAALGGESLIPVFAVTGLMGSLPLAASGLRHLRQLGRHRQRARRR